MRKILLAFLILFNSAAPAQEVKGYDRVYFSYSRQNYRDKNSIKYDGINPDNHLDPVNPDSHCWALQYERTTSYGLTLAVEIQYGKRRYNMSIVQDLTNFDPNGVNALKDYRYSIGSYGARTIYWGPKILIGYWKKLGKNLTGTAKVGIADKLFISNGWGMSYVDFKYPLDNGSSNYVPSALVVESRYARPEPYYSKPKFPNTIPSFELYLGIERELKLPVLKNLSIGIEASRGWWMWNRHETVIVHSSPSVSQIGTSKDIFIDRNICFGLRMAIGMWK